MKLLDIRNKLKAKKPSFRRHDSHKKSRVSVAWRRPKGIQNKQRLHRRGYAVGRSTGYGSPKEVFGLSPEGLTQTVVMHVKELSTLNPKTDGIIIARSLGNKKRAELIAAATEKNFTILNIRVDEFNKSLASSLVAKKSRKKSISKKREAKEKAAAKKESKKESSQKDEQSDISPEEKKVEEKKEHDKILTKGDQQ